MNPFWDWAADRWTRPGVEAACLTLQDEYGQCAPLLLWALWTAQEERFAPDRLPEAIALAREWEAEVTGPLRRARRGLTGLADQNLPRRAALEAEVRKLELRAERALIEALEGMAGEQRTRPDLALQSVVRAWGGPSPGAALVPLLVAAA